MLIDSTEAINNPIRTRAADANTVISNAISGDGPVLSPTPICQRCAVLKNLACSGKLPRKMCGGGNSLASATPQNHSTSQITANSPIDASAQPARAAACAMFSGGAKRRGGGE